MKNILIIHDASSFGKCSTTVALPILSSMHLQGTILPTALLSTHTGPGFEGFTFLDLTDEMEKIVDHWHSFGLKFDAAYVGYLGSVRQIKFLEKELPKLLKDDAKFYLDPVMADNGSFYYGFDEEYAKEMLNLCAMADVIMPNQTEASFLYGVEYTEGIWPQEKIDEFLTLVRKQTNASVILTGAGYDGESQTGAYYLDVETGEKGLATGPFIGGKFHGTGDIFGSIFVGALANGASVKVASQLAVDYIPKIIEKSLDDPDVMMNGLQFALFLGDLSHFVSKLKANQQ